MKAPEETFRPESHNRLLWFALVAGGVAWGVHLGAGYILVTLPCIMDIEETMVRIALYGLTASMAAVAFAATTVAVFKRRAYARRPTGDLAESGGPEGFLVAGAILISGVSFFAIIIQSMQLPVLAFC